MPPGRAFRVNWSEPARDDLASVADYILSQDSAKAAVEAVERIERAAGRLFTMPQRGRIVPELAALGVRRYRELVERPWRIVYTTDTGSVTVLAVLDARRDLEDLLIERLLR